ncbi:hypothetical protein DK26_23370 [Bosea sp. WAO]|uniref:hypothetical protein n=1 Tax=Bosea sp. WAO TaxID=406341 RepID=UPI000749D0A2|nr:hypothetical protein [Bosea sp. WAO]KUL93462.1 hypothetical protein DK26_23370 [Bosea sp. WAO]
MSQLALIPKQDLTRPPEPEEFHADMLLLLSAFPSQQRQEPAQVIATYMVALEGHSAAAIHAGIMRFIHGEWPAHDAVWLPSCAMVSRAVKAEAEAIQRRIEAAEGEAFLARRRARTKAKEEADARHAKQLELEHAKRTPEERAAWVAEVRGLLPRVSEGLSDD